MSQTLRNGDQGQDVKKLQEILNSKLTPSPELEADGDFGNLTEAAVRLYQASVGLGIDGVVGPKTWAALEQGVIQPSRPAAPRSEEVQDAPWMAVATNEIGQKEIAGRQHNPRIVEYHASTTLSASSDETPWCASFVNWCLIQAGLNGTNSAAAASWCEWGQPCSAKQGAITVIFNAAAARSSLTSSGNHVGFLIKETDTHYFLLGGNQSDQVKISTFPKSAWVLKAYRWPK